MTRYYIYNNLKISYCYLTYGLALSLLCVVASKNLNNFMDSVQQADSPVKVTPVFINCETDDIQKRTDNEDNRFEREELFKHNALRNCDKKLALTIKLTSKSANSADEYVPIDHVLEGRSKRRVRLLNPYVLRLRRDAPLEAYKLRFIETVSGLLVNSKKQIQKESERHILATRQTPRDTREDINMLDDWHSESVVAEPRHAYLARRSYLLRLAGTGRAAALSPGSNRPPSQARGGLKTNSENKKVSEHLRPAKRYKRHVKNVIIEEEGRLGTDREVTENAPGFYFSKTTNNSRTNNNNEIVDVGRETGSTVLSEIKPSVDCKPLPQYKANDNMDNSERVYALYEIEKPVLWFFVHVQLFEKLSTFTGNTLWNDITKGVPVSVSSVSTEWSGSDINVNYKPIDHSEREDFVLPNSSLSLLVPILEENSIVDSLGRNFRIDNANYILIPSEDILDIDNTNKAKRTFENGSANEIKESRRKVIVQVARALNEDMENKLNVVKQTSDNFLTVRHRGVRHAQVDLEARADDNQLVHASVPGRIAFIVADSIRDNRSTLTMQVTNTGILVARFRAEIRDCDSDLMNLSEKQEGSIKAEEVWLAPRHTRLLTLHMQPPSPPGEAAGLQHCSVYLLNEKGEYVAVRNALIKKGDHCYCVWHCDCVCYGDDPRLPCREMSAARQDAAGLPSRRGGRLARACEYADAPTINIVVVVVGVIGMLLFMGVLKGLLGLVWPRAGVWGLEWILEEPRLIDCYYERCLRARKVVYDGKGWPVHPDTRKRTVRVVSLMVEFILNVIFFVVIPGLVAVEIFKSILKVKTSKTCFEVGRNNDNRQKLPEDTSIKYHNTQLFHLEQNKKQRPELKSGRASESKSDQEDTAFVLMTMKKSAESLARIDIKPDTADLPIEHTVRVPTEPAGKDSMK